MPDHGLDVAIVGLAAVFPGAADADAYWHNLARGHDAIGDVPAARWDPVYFDPAATAVDRFYCRRGGFVDDQAGFDPIAFGIMPVTVQGAEPDQLLALHVAARALADAGLTERLPRARTGVILGRGGYLTPGMARLSQRVRTAQQLATTLAELMPDLDAATLDRVRTTFSARAGELGAEAAIGLVPNLAASRIANRLDLHGPAYTVDAACASSLVAVDQACGELARGRCDVVLAGGVHVCHDVTFWSVFTQLGALSRAQQIRPFDRRADGILIGEGAGVVVLKRRADAERDGDRIYAIIRGTGVASDGRESSPMRPRLGGQVAAMAQAWRDAACDPATVGMIEAHGTATPTGDAVELAALAQFFGGPDHRPAPGLGSVKSMIGHAMPAAGVAGLIKAALALHHDLMPPSLHCDEPRAELAATRFRMLTAAEPWGERPRRAGVSAFGFGGINAHVVLEAAGGVAPTPRRVRARAAPSTPALLTLAAGSIAELAAALDGGPAPGGPMRLALVDPSPERRALAKKVLARGQPWRGRNDLWFTPRGLGAAGGRLAFVFPGIEIVTTPDVSAVAAELGVAVPPALASPIDAARDLEHQGLAVFALGRLLDLALRAAGHTPDVYAGHSLGEWTGMVVSELVPPAAAAAFVGGLRPGSLEVPDVVFAAVGCGAVGAEAAIAGLDDIAVSHDNCPHQSILCGRHDRVRTALARLAERGVLCQELPFRSGFHSPLLADYLGPHRAHLATLALARPRTPMWSATSCAPYPEEPDAIRALAIDHLVKPVRFRELVTALAGAGVRGFVQLGVGSLTNFIGDTLRGVDHLAVAASADKGDAAAQARQLARVRAALWVEGWDGAPAARASSPPPRPLPRLDLGAALVRLDGALPPLARPATTSAAPIGDLAAALADVTSPIAAELAALLREAAEASAAVAHAWRQPPTILPTPPARARTLRRTLSVAADPALVDHCFYRQPPGWPEVADRFPVAPMTMMLGMMRDAAQALAPDRVVIALEDVAALRWLAVAPPVEVELTSRRTADDAVEVELVGYARATARLAAAYPPAPAARTRPLTAPRPTPVDAAQLYADRWMFHGPGYAGVTAMGPMGDDGVDGEITALPAPGALLDCAGQLMGWWVMDHERIDRLAMPIRIARVALYGPEPTPGTRVACAVRFRALTAVAAIADHELTVAGRVWCQIDAWEDRRFDSDEPLWKVLQYPEHNALAEVTADGYALVTEHWRTVASRELVMRRYLGVGERAQHDAVGARGRRAWLLGRIAVKDAVRRHLWAAGAGPLYPIEIAVGNHADGRPFVTVPDGRALAVSLAHKDELAVALIAPAGATPGIDLERIEARPASFEAVAVSPAELALGGAGDRDAWLARVWAGKEAVAKARGTGLTDPRHLTCTAVAGDRLTIDGVAVDTRTHGAHVVAWTWLEPA
ncbi:MAG: polyketide synthase dehydratase domain-containing protein [Myxococcales bacterium]|nr:polyketide synthase dehydratase domain-containing protein [Myxococcales bacterium]